MFAVVLAAFGEERTTEEQPSRGKMQKELMQNKNRINDLAIKRKSKI